MSNKEQHPRVVYLVQNESGTFTELDTTGLLSGQMSGTEPKSGHKSGSEFLSGHKSDRELVDQARRVDSRTDYDPHAVHRDFPDRWQTYIRANYRHLGHVQQVFGVSERTARKWWNGETGANGGHVAIAVNEHPVSAPRMLFAAE